jgi:Flp pilus assembly protein CpaB
MSHHTQSDHDTNMSNVVDGGANVKALGKRISGAGEHKWRCQGYQAVRLGVLPDTANILQVQKHVGDPGLDLRSGQADVGDPRREGR